MPNPERYELAAPPAQAVAYLFPERFKNASEARAPMDKTFVFQYWPESVTDQQGVNYSSKEIPGGSHPLYQYVGGGERTISFDALFTSEIEEFDPFSVKHSGIPSSRYTVDVRAAIARLESFKLPKYPRNGANGRVKPPPRLILVFPKTNLGRNSDQIAVILKEISWNFVSWFPSGVPRVVQASLSFGETVQRVTTQGSNIRFIGRETYGNDLLRRYNFNNGGITGRGRG